MTDTPTTPAQPELAAGVATAINAVNEQALIADAAAKGIEASKAASSKVRQMLEEQLATANFNLVDDLNTKFSEFLQYEAIRARLDYLLEKASGTTSSSDIGGSLDDVMEDIHEITSVLSPGKGIIEGSKFFGKIYQTFKHGFKSQAQIFNYGVRDLKGKVRVVESVISTEKINITNTVELIKEYLPAVTEDIVRLEYLDRFLEEFIERQSEEINEQALQFIKDYRVALQTMKQVSSVSVLRIIMGLSRIVTAKSHLDKVEMKFTMNLGTLVFENLIANQIQSAYDVTESIEIGIDALNEKNKDLHTANREAELNKQKKNIALLKGLEGKLVEIKQDFETYNNEIAALNAEVDAFMPTYKETYDKLAEMREKSLDDQRKAGEAMKELLGDNAWDEDKLIKQNKEIQQKREAAMDAVVEPSA